MFSTAFSASILRRSCQRLETRLRMEKRNDYIHRLLLMAKTLRPEKLLTWADQPWSADIGDNNPFLNSTVSVAIWDRGSITPRLSFWYAMSINRSVHGCWIQSHGSSNIQRHPIDSVYGSFFHSWNSSQWRLSLFWKVRAKCCDVVLNFMMRCRTCWSDARPSSTRKDGPSSPSGDFLKRL
jgi:hypothetical protein